MAIYKRDIVDINLETGNIHRSFLKHSIGYLDQAADHFGIRVLRNGEPVDLTGVTVQGIFMPPQGNPIAITGSTYTIVSENVAEVVLPQACYNYDGQFTLSIKLVDATNAVTGTMRIVDGMVDNTHASGTVAPTETVPTYQEILSVYADMITALETVGELDDEVSDLESAIDESCTTAKIAAWEPGTFKGSDGTNTTSSTSIRNATYRGISTGEYYARAIGDYCFLLYAYNKSSTYIGALQDDGTFAKSSTNLAKIKEFYFSKYPSYKFKIVLKRDDAGDIATSEGTNFELCYYTDSMLQKNYKAADAWAVDKRSRLVSRTFDEAVGIGCAIFNIGANIEMDMVVDPEDPPVVDIDNPVKSNYAYAVAECQEGDVFTVNCAVTGSTLRTAVFLNSAKQFISGRKGTLDGVEITAPENAAYLVLRTRCELSASPYTDYYAYKGKRFSENEFRYHGKVTYGGRTSMLECVQNGWYRFSTSDIPSISDMPVGDTSGGHILKTYVGALGTSDAILQELLRSDGKNWIRWLSESNGQYIVYKDWMANVVTNWAEGLKMGVVGHSGPAGTHTSRSTAWPAIAAKELGCISIKNIAVGGSTIAKSPVIEESSDLNLRKETYEEIYFSEDDFQTAITGGSLDTAKQYLVKDDPANDHPFMIYRCTDTAHPTTIGSWTAKYDAHNAANGGRAPVSDVIKGLDLDVGMIVIGAGANDYTYAYTPFGTFADSENTTFYGALHVLLSYIMNTYKGKPVFFADATISTRASWTTPNAIGKTYEDYYNAIKEVCAYYRVPFIDIDKNVNIPFADVDSDWYYDDNKHLSVMGHERVGKYVAGAIAGYLY